MTLENLETQIINTRMEEMQAVDRLFQDSLRKMGIITIFTILIMCGLTHIIISNQNTTIQIIAAIIQAIAVYVSLSLIDKHSRMPKTHHFTKKSDTLCLQYAKLCIELGVPTTQFGNTIAKKI